MGTSTPKPITNRPLNPTDLVGTQGMAPMEATAATSRAPAALHVLVRLLGRQAASDIWRASGDSTN